MCFALIVFEQGYVVHTHTGGYCHRANSSIGIKEAAEYRSKQLCRGQQAAEPTCDAPRFQPAWYQNLGDA